MSEEMYEDTSVKDEQSHSAGTPASAHPVAMHFIKSEQDPKHFTDITASGGAVVVG